MKNEIFKPPTIDEDEISKPKIPQFDRSIKPIFKVVPEFIRQPFVRDFSPTPGPTLVSMNFIYFIFFSNKYYDLLL